MLSPLVGHGTSTPPLPLACPFNGDEPEAFKNDFLEPLFRKYTDEDGFDRLSEFCTSVKEEPKQEENNPLGEVK